MHAAALEQPLAVHLAQTVFVTAERRERNLVVLAVIVREIAAAHRALARHLEADVAHHVTHLRAAHRFMIPRGELLQTRRAFKFPKERALERAVRGEAFHPLLIASIIDREGITGIQLANLFTIVPGSGDSHNDFPLTSPALLLDSIPYGPPQIAPSSRSFATSSQL